MPSLASFFVTPIRITVPKELTSEAELLKFLSISTAELKKIWWFRGRMYQKFEISKGEGKKRVISAPDRRLKMLQTKIASSLAPPARALSFQVFALEPCEAFVACSEQVHERIAACGVGKEVADFGGELRFIHGAEGNLP